ncbi:MAG: glycosyltransferase family 9 protein [Deltaproteobacteria bacterium]
MVTSKDEREGEIQSILVIHQGALGDFILALPALRVLRKTFPKARSVIMGYPRILELVEKRFYAEEIVSVDSRGMASFFVRGGTLDAGLTGFFSAFDLIVVFGKDGEGPVIGNLRRVCEGRILHINSFPPEHDRIHLSEHLLRELRRYSLSIPGQEPKLYLTRADQEWGRTYCRRKGLTASESLETIIIHPGSGSKKKVWPVERFVDVVRHLKSHTGSRILVVLGPAEGPEVQKAFEVIEWEMGPLAPIFLKGLSLLELASVIDGSCLFVGNDSGITHMAAALGVPTVAIFGPSDPKVWSPRGKKVVVVRRKIACSPCSQENFFHCQNIECLKKVEVEDVLAGVARLGFEL